MATKKIKNKKLLYLTGVFVLLIIYFLVFETRMSEKESKKNNLFQYVLADIKKIEIQKDKQVVMLERTLNKWSITKPRELKGSKTDIDAYLTDVKNIQKGKMINEKADNLVVYGLEKPKLVLKVWKKGEESSLSLGTQNPDKTGYYAKFNDEKKIWLIETLAESTIDKNLYHFRDKTIFTKNIEDIKEFHFQYNQKKYLIIKENNTWVMKRPIEYAENQVEIKRIISGALDISIKDFFDDPKKKVNLSDTGLLSSDISIKMIDNQNQSYILNIAKEIKDANQYYAKINNNSLIFAVDKFIIDNLDKDLEKLQTEKLKRDEERLQKQKEEEEKQKLKEEEAKNEANKKK